MQEIWDQNANVKQAETADTSIHMLSERLAKSHAAMGELIEALDKKLEVVTLPANKESDTVPGSAHSSGTVGDSEHSQLERVMGNHLRKSEDNLCCLEDILKRIRL